MGVVCNWCGGKFDGAGPGPKWGHDTTLCLHNQFVARKVRINALEAALREITELPRNRQDEVGAIARHALQATE